jgi:tetratricopeptide (TPR) repeat protein
MSQARETSELTPRSLADLFTQYLHRQVAAQAESLGFADAEGQVVPHEAVSVQPVDPQRAWNDALAVVRHFPASQAEPRWQVPPDWASLIASHEPAIALAFCIGNFPQLVRDLYPLLNEGDLAVLRQLPTRTLSIPPSVLEWAMRTRTSPQVLLAAGVLRLARRFDEAAELLRSKTRLPSQWQAVWANEEAGLLWHRGRADEALALWQAQKASVPVLFNRGMASLFLGRTTEAQTALGEAVAQLPEMSAWHHLGHLYLTLATARD